MQHRKWRVDTRIPILVIAGLAAASLTVNAESETDSSLWFSFSPSARGSMKIDVGGSSYATLSTVGSLYNYSDRSYDDGYVDRDSSEGGGILPNSTWNWGYDNVSQYNAGAGSLSFSRSGIPGYTAFDGGRGTNKDLYGGGFKIDAGIPLIQEEKWGLDLVFGFEGNWSEGKVRQSARYVNLTDTYNVSSISTFPAAGHSGTYAGPFDPAGTPPYTIISNLPQSRSTTPFAGTVASGSSISMNVDQGLYSFHLGPQINFIPVEKLSFYARPSVSINIMDVSITRSESFTLADGTGSRHWSDKNSELVCYPGAGVIGGANYDLGDGWFAGAFAGYEWVQKLKMDVGPSKVIMNPSGWVAGLSIGKKF